MAGEQHLKYNISDVLFDRENSAKVGVFVNCRRFHITFKPTDLRHPGQSCPSIVELEYFTLVKETDDLLEDLGLDLLTEQDSLSTQGKKRATLSPCDGACSEDLFEAWILQPVIQYRIFQKNLSAFSLTVTLQLTSSHSSSYSLIHTEAGGERTCAHPNSVPSTELRSAFFT